MAHRKFVCNKNFICGCQFAHSDIIRWGIHSSKEPDALQLVTFPKSSAN